MLHVNYTWQDSSADYALAIKNRVELVVIYIHIMDYTTHMYILQKVRRTRSYIYSHNGLYPYVHITKRCGLIPVVLVCACDIGWQSADWLLRPVLVCESWQPDTAQSGLFTENSSITHKQTQKAILAPPPGSLVVHALAARW